MTAVVDGIIIEGKPEEINEFIRLRTSNWRDWQESLEKMMKKPPEPIPALATLNINVT